MRSEPRRARTAVVPALIIGLGVIAHGSSLAWASGASPVEAPEAPAVVAPGGPAVAPEAPGAGPPTPAPEALGAPHAGRQIYERACAACHGTDGRGRGPERVGFAVPLPDFTDCSFATREPTPDWVGVAHSGGPTRGFARIMPAFGDAVSPEQLEHVIHYVRGFCPDPAWPPGDLNMPRAMFTEKAYVEDEFVVTVGGALEEPAAIDAKLVYETRFGARNQVEVIVPFGLNMAETEGTTGDFGPAAFGVGDVALGVKRVFLHSADSGTIFSAAAEVKLPTGDEADGYGKGTAALEPFLAFGQLLPADSFLHLQAGAELPVNTEQAEMEGFARGALGTTFVQGLTGRAWSPIVEVLAKRDLEEGADTAWDVVPQLQVSLNTRQHVLASVAVRVPVSQRDERATALFVYLLWDWFDGGLLEGW